MSIYFADLMEENKALMLALLRLKAETATLEPGEAELLDLLRSHDGLPEQTQFPMEAPPAAPPVERPSPGRRRSANGRSRQGAPGGGRRAGGGERPGPQAVD